MHMLLKFLLDTGKVLFLLINSSNKTSTYTYRYSYEQIKSTRQNYNTQRSNCADCRSADQAYLIWYQRKSHDVLSYVAHNKCPPRNPVTWSEPRQLIEKLCATMKFKKSFISKCFFSERSPWSDINFIFRCGFQPEIVYRQQWNHGKKLITLKI